jgi:hypothetical protein
VADDVLGSIITETWPWILYPPLYLATAVLLLVTLRPGHAGVPAESPRPSSPE